MSAIEPSPARHLTSEADAIETARQVAAQIAELAADPRNNGQLPHRQAELLSSSGLTAIAVPDEAMADSKYHHADQIIRKLADFDLAAYGLPPMS